MPQGSGRPGKRTKEFLSGRGDYSGTARFGSGPGGYAQEVRNANIRIDRAMADDKTKRAAQKPKFLKHTKPIEAWDSGKGWAKRFRDDR